MARGIIAALSEFARNRLRDPDEVRDDLALQRYDRLLAQIPLLYTTMIFVALISVVGLNQHAPDWLRVGLPIAISALSALRIFVWYRRRGRAVTADQARKTIRSMSYVAFGMCTLCSIWCVLSWQNALVHERPYIAIFMVAGTLSVAYCLSNIRRAAMASLFAGLAPVTLLLLIEGRPMDMASAASILIACTFLMRMIMHQHDQLVALLTLQIGMRRLASTDALTGLANRRALYERLEGALAAGMQPAIALVDLDGFKPVNDTYGHAAGDALLRATAQRLDAACGEHAIAHRLGGDEFALFLPMGGDAAARMIVDRVLLAMATPFDLDGFAIWIGASAGWAVTDEQSGDADALVASADRALYAAKAMRKAPPPPIHISHAA